MNPNPLTPSARSVTTMHWQQEEADKATQTALENIGALTKEHNPDALTPEQIGVADGWRLLNEDEIVSADGILLNPTCESWDNDRWSGRGDLGIFSDLTYRTKLSPAELRKERGLEPKAEAVEAKEAEEPSPEAMALALKFTSIIAKARLARQIDELVARKTAELKADSDNLDAYGANLRGQIADLEKLLLAKDATLFDRSELVTFTSLQRTAARALALTPASVRAKYVPAEELAACQREREIERRSNIESTAITKAAHEKERDSLAARVKELEALEKPRQKHVEVLAELERVKEELSRVSNYLRIEKQTHQEWEDSLRAQLSAANEARDKAEASAKENEALAEDGQALSELVWAHSVEGSDAYEVEVVLESHYEALAAAHADKLEADATVERMREELEYGRKALANYGAAWQPQSLSIPRPTALREHDLALAERAWKAVRWTDGFSFAESAIYRELTKGEGE